MNRNNDELTCAAQLDSYQHNHIFVLIQITVRDFCVKQRSKQCSCNIPRMISEGRANCKSQKDWTYKILCPIQPCLLDLVVCYVLPFLRLKTSHPVPLHRHLSTCHYGLWGQAPGLLWSQITLPSGHGDPGSKPARKPHAEGKQHYWPVQQTFWLIALRPKQLSHSCLKITRKCEAQ